MARRILSSLPAAAAFLVAAAALVALATGLGIAGAGCDAGSPRPCTVTCGGGGECPEGTQCGPDSFCYGPGETPGSCPTGDDDLGDSADDSGDIGDGTDGPECDPCDPVEQCGCPDGEACYVGSPSPGPVCAAAGQRGEEGFCAVDAECTSGYGCAFADTLDAGHCQRYCDDDADCGGFLALCNRTASATSDIRLCTSDCDPIDTSACAAGEKCTFGLGEDARWDANCSPHAGGLVFEPCTFESDCGPGLVCVADDIGATTCETLCLLSDPLCPGLMTCGGLVPRLVFGGVEYGACI